MGGISLKFKTEVRSTDHEVFMLFIYPSRPFSFFSRGFGSLLLFHLFYKATNNFEISNRTQLCWLTELGLL